LVLGCYGQSYQVRRYSGVDGLANAHVFDVTQDHWGRMWFATRGGISCYDGVDWKNYTMADGLPVQSFLKISPDRKGRIWALSDPFQQEKLFVVFYDTSPAPAWHQIETLEFNLIDHLDITSFQLLEQEKDNTPIVVVGTIRSGIFRWQAGKWERLTTKNGLLSNSVTGTAVWKGKCYVATDNGISVLKNNGTIDNQLNQLLDFPLKEIKGICIEYKDKYPDYQLKHSRLWIYGHQWLGYLYLDESHYKTVQFQPGISFSKKRETYNLLPDYRGGLYIGNPFDVYYFNYKTGTLESLHTINGLIGEAALSMFIDFEKNVWIACGRGISKITSRRFSNFQMIHGLLEEEVTAVLEVEPGKFVFGHNRGLTFWDRKQFKKMPFTGRDGAELPFCRVLDIKKDAKQNTWVVAERVGVARINKQRQIKWYGSHHGLPDNLKITSIWIDTTNNVWAGCDQGLFFMAANENRFVSIPVNQFPIPAVRKIYINTKRILYLGSTFNGVYEYEIKKNQWKNYRVPGGNGANNVFALAPDHRGRLLVGTAAGLLTLDTEQETLKRYSENKVEIHHPVYFIVRDHQQRLWFGTNNGVIRWDGSQYRKYSLAEGLVGHETNRAAGIVDSKGRVWIGTNRGVSIYNEQFDDHINWKPKLRLLYLEAEHRKIPIDPLNPPVQLNYKTNTLIFHFRGVSFLDETAIRFKHKLEGFDRDWLDEHYPFKQVIRYSNLQPGQYRFHLKVKNSLGVWSDTEISPEVVILEPFYKRWWFSLLVFLLVVFILYAIFRFFLERRHAVLLEKQVEERTHQLQAVEKQYRSLFEDSKDVVFISSPGGKLIDINPAGVEILGFQSKQELLGLGSVLNVYSNPGDRAAFREEIEKQGYVKDFEITVKRKDGELITGQVTATTVRDKQGKITAYRGIIRDITQQRKLEQRLVQAQKMEAIGTLAGGIAHDFNNILAVIMGRGEFIFDELPEGVEKIEGPQIDSIRKSAESIVTASDRGAELVKQILTFSRQSNPSQTPINLSDIVKDALGLLRSILPATIEIDQDIQAGSGLVLADSTQIRQIMMNLGTNAAHAMAQPGGTLQVNLHEVHMDEETVKSYQDIKAGIYLRLSVSDTGHGMTHQVMKRIFEPYYTTKKTGEGTGMGLAVTHGIVKNLGGDITVNSEPGKGTTFHVVLPKFAGEVKLKSKIKIENAADVPRGKERILLVDDEIELVESGIRVLKWMGYQVKGVTNPTEALEMIRAQPHQFDLIISDFSMPQMNGIQLAEEIRRINHGIPFVLLSGYSSDVPKKQIKSTIINGFITKPISKNDLARVIRKVLDENHPAPGV
jgi:PAS domain S-box-containing protein